MNLSKFTSRNVIFVEVDYRVFKCVKSEALALVNDLHHNEIICRNKRRNAVVERLLLLMKDYSTYIAG